MADELEFWDRLKYLFSDPNFFFEKVKKEKGIKDSLITYAIVALLMTIVGLVFSFGLMGIMFRSYSLASGFFMPTFAIVGFIIGIIMTFLYSALVHVTVIVVRGKGGYPATYNTYTYSMIPFLLLSAIPLVGSLAIVYSFILMIIGISKVHDISKGKAALACLLPVAVILAILLFLLFSILSQISYMF